MTGLKAFAVLENDENTGAIYFAKRDIEARKAGANEFGDGDISNVSCRRAPWADEYAEAGVVPAKACIAHGWHFECCGCGSTIDEDYLDEEDLLLDGVIGQQHGRVFCSEICECRFNLDKAISRDKERRMIDILKDVVRKRFPGVEFADGKDNWKPHAYATSRGGVWQVEQAVVSFNFPGMKIGPASLRFDLDHRKIGPVKPHYNCCFGDKEAFEAYADATSAKNRMPEAAEA